MTVKTEHDVVNLIELLINPENAFTLRRYIVVGGPIMVGPTGIEIRTIFTKSLWLISRPSKPTCHDAIIFLF